jgi:hypothetical protein
LREKATQPIIAVASDAVYARVFVASNTPAFLDFFPEIRAGEMRHARGHDEMLQAGAVSMKRWQGG